MGAGGLIVPQAKARQEVRAEVYRPRGAFNRGRPGRRLVGGRRSADKWPTRSDSVTPSAFASWPNTFRPGLRCHGVTAVAERLWHWRRGQLLLNAVCGPTDRHDEGQLCRSDFRTFFFSQKNLRATSPLLRTPATPPRQFAGPRFGNANPYPRLASSATLTLCASFAFIAP
jgi:hypothetical protein